jgi:acyl-CoA thioester hydrolase
MGVSELEVRVRYAETDQMGVAHHASYFVWFEAGRTEFIRGRGRSYAQIEEDGWLLVVIEAHCQFRRPARYDDVLFVRTHLRDLRPATLAFGYELVRRADGEVLAQGYTVHAAVDRDGRPRRIPGEIRRLLGPADDDFDKPAAAQNTRASPAGRNRQERPEPSGEITRPTTG